MTLEPTRAHYQTLLAPIYRWMLGDFASALSRSQAELESLGIGRARAHIGARGLDLGAGLGLQTLPLAAAGYAMTAVDSSEALLDELAAARPDVSTVLGDIRDDAVYSADSYDVIVCMGDTLTHLSSRDEVDRLLKNAVQALRRAGKFACTFRDYASTVRESTDRFILVRSDAERLLTCCLDYGPDRVRVTDLVHERGASGWVLRASAYQKLRLPGDWVAARLRHHGASVQRMEVEMGRVCVVAERP